MPSIHQKSQPTIDEMLRMGIRADEIGMPQDWSSLIHKPPAIDLQRTSELLANVENDKSQHHLERLAHGDLSLIGQFLSTCPELTFVFIVMLSYRFAECAEPKELPLLKKQSLSVQAFAVTFSPNGKVLAIGAGKVNFSSEGGIRSITGHVLMMDMRLGVLSVCPHKFDWLVVAVAISPDGRRLCAATLDDLRIWTIGAKSSDQRIRGYGLSTRFTRDGHEVAAIRGTRVSVFNAKTAKLIRTKGTTNKSAYTALGYSASKSLLAAARTDGSIDVLSFRDDKEKQHVETNYQGLKAMAFSPDGDKLAISQRTGAIAIWSIQKRRAIVQITGHTNRVKALCFDPTGHKLASASVDGTIRIWRADDGAELYRSPEFANLNIYGNSLAFSPDGNRLVSALGGAQFQIWSVK